MKTRSAISALTLTLKVSPWDTCVQSSLGDLCDLDKCDKCDKEISNRANTNRHKETVHFICRYCKSENQLGNFEKLLTHKENEHFICCACGKQSLDGAKLAAHKQKCSRLAQAAANDSKGKGKGTKSTRARKGQGRVNCRSVPGEGSASA